MPWARVWVSMFYHSEVSNQHATFSEGLAFLKSCPIATEGINRLQLLLLNSGNHWHNWQSHFSRLLTGNCIYFGNIEIQCSLRWKLYFLYGFKRKFSSLLWPLQAVFYKELFLWQSLPSQGNFCPTVFPWIAPVWPDQISVRKVCPQSRMGAFWSKWLFWHISRFFKRWDFLF